MNVFYPKTLLSIGCGYGKFPLYMYDKYNLDKVVGVDIAQAVVEKLCEEHGDKQGLAFHTAYMHDLPFDDNAFDAVTAFDVLEHVPEDFIDKSIAEAKRVSKTGMVASVAWHSDVKWGEELHVTIRPKEWWLDKFSDYGEVRCIQDKELGMFVTVWWG